MRKNLAMPEEGVHITHRRLRQENGKFRFYLSYRVSSGLAWVTHRYLVTHIKNI